MTFCMFYVSKLRAFSVRELRIITVFFVSYYKAAEKVTFSKLQAFEFVRNDVKSKRKSN